MCGLNGCRSHHNRMLHEDGDDNKTSLNDSTVTQHLSEEVWVGKQKKGSLVRGPT